MNKNISFLEDIPTKEVHLELYIDESKERLYNGEKITYIMAMAIPTEKKNTLFDKINNARCLSDTPHNFKECSINCKYHTSNNIEIHYSNTNRDRTTNSIAQRWIDILLENNFQNNNAIFFNILGINETRLNINRFGDKDQFANIYCRFFRTTILRLLRMFNSFDKIIVDKIYHDSTNEMESHPYFKTSAIKKITLQEIFKTERKIFFETNEINFIDSNHKVSGLNESQFIQFVDLILGCTTNAIHNIADNKNKKALTEKIYPLISRILGAKKDNNSYYNFFNKQTISFFPKYSEENSRKLFNSLSPTILEDLLHSSANFENTKALLFHPNDNQISFF